MNALTHARHPGTITVAEESTAWPGVSRPVHLGGLGFTYKWNMGWMHDILQYVGRDPIYRRWAHNELTFSMLYAYHENFVLPFSHDEVVHGKGSLLDKMPGDDWQKFATLRACSTATCSAIPARSCCSWADEFGQWREWDHDASLDWHLLEHAPHRSIRQLVADLNALYGRETALHQVDFDAAGFQWIDCNDHENSVVSFLRRGREAGEQVVVVLNFTPVVARALPHRRARGRSLQGVAQHRRGDVRRVECRERGRRRLRGGRRARVPAIGRAEASAARLPDAEAGRFDVAGLRCSRRASARRAPRPLAM